MLAAGIPVGLGIVGFLVVQRRGKLGAVARWMVSRKLGGIRLQVATHHLSELDGALQRFYREHGRDLPMAVAWHAAGMAFGILQSWYFLDLLTGEASLPMAAAVSFL